MGECVGGWVALSGVVVRRWGWLELSWLGRPQAAAKQPVSLSLPLLRETVVMRLVCATATSSILPPAGCLRMWWLMAWCHLEWLVYSGVPCASCAWPLQLAVCISQQACCSPSQQRSRGG